MNKLVRCPTCNGNISINSTFCVHCGEPFPASVVVFTDKRCNYCDDDGIGRGENEDGTPYAHRCGICDGTKKMKESVTVLVAADMQKQ